jgi:hypothetical protein
LGHLAGCLHSTVLHQHLTMLYVSSLPAVTMPPHNKVKLCPL